MGEPPPACPRCGAVGPVVERRTVAAVTTSSLPPSQVMRLCSTEACSLIYYGEAGAEVDVASLSLLPVFKGGDVLCFCFSCRDSGATAAMLQLIAARVRAGECACDLRNPSGRCCLPEVRRSAEGRSNSDGGHGLDQGSGAT
jgi:hypothetical protein